jgi:hypothetical protein
MTNLLTGDTGLDQSTPDNIDFLLRQKMSVSGSSILLSQTNKQYFAGLSFNNALYHSPLYYPAELFPDRNGS